MELTDYTDEELINLTVDLRCKVDEPLDYDEHMRLLEELIAVYDEREARSLRAYMRARTGI